MSTAMESVLRSDDSVAAWWGTRVECQAALRRLERGGQLQATDLSLGLDVLAEMFDAWSEVAPSESVRAEAERAAAVHPLRAGGALQLGAALVWRPNPGARGELVALDRRLRDAAAREGFKVLPADLAS